jgi:hypothetical protein
MKFSNFSVAELYEINRRMKARSVERITQSASVDLSEAIRDEFAHAVTFSREEIREAFKVAYRRLKEQEK